MIQKILLSLAALAVIAGCAQTVDAVERLGECVAYGDQDNNCELSTLAEGHQDTPVNDDL